MPAFYKISAMLCCLLCIALLSRGQQVYKGKIIDAASKEPIAGASIRCTNNACTCGCATADNGSFELKPMDNCCTNFAVTSIGYQPMMIPAAQLVTVISLQPENSALQEVVVTANKEGVRRSLAPIAISSISSKMIQDAKPVGIDQVLNKVSGVYMVNLGNEQHSMSIRQPISTKSLFLYLEDGIPIRTTGLFNHNALLEINMASVKNIEVIKGPSSSLYGSEAIGGVVNFITASPTAVPVAKISLQGNTIGYKRTDLQNSFQAGKWGFVISGYYADKRNSYIDYTDFHKTSLTVRADYRFNKKTLLTNSFNYIDYYSDMAGGIDSARFVNRSFGSQQTFTYRKVKSLRYRSTLAHNWSEQAKTSVSLVFRDNTIGQNPAYGIKDDYRRLASGAWVGKKDLAHGEINEAGFRSYAAIVQHRQSLAWKDAVIIAGASVDLSPSDYSAQYIRVQKDSVTGVYKNYQGRDSILTDYRNGLNNYAAFLNFEFSPVNKLRVVASLRGDMFRYKFDNHLKPSAYSGSADTLNHFSRISPKIGFTYNFSPRIGFYANYSEGFVPPQVTEMYKGVKVPDLQPSVFYNSEIGGWAEIIREKLSADFSIYSMKGTNEIVSVRMDDGSTQNMNAGKTSHRGIEFGVNATPSRAISIRWSAAYSRHEFNQFVEKGVSYNDNEMNGAPNWIHNAEIWYKPAFIAGFRIGAEWQRVGSYYMDPLNTVEYKGYNVFHLRAGYKWKSMEIWANLMNVTDNYYAYTSSKSNSGYSYTPAEPRHINVGIGYDFGSLFKKQKNETK